MGSIQTVAPRWKKLIQTQIKRERGANEEKYRDAMVSDSSIRDSASMNYFANAEPNAQFAQSSQSTTDIIDIGILAHQPGAISQLIVAHQRQMEAAWKILVTTQSVG